MKVRSREPVEVIELQRTRLAAPPAILGCERATPAVTLEDLTFDGVGDVTRGPCVCVRAAERRRARAANERQSVALHASAAATRAPRRRSPTVCEAKARNLSIANDSHT